MSTRSNHTFPTGSNAHVLSARDEALKNSSPITILLLSVCLIFASIFIVFLVWARNLRRKASARIRNEPVFNRFDDLAESLESPRESPRESPVEDSSDGRPLKLGVRTPSKPEFVICADSESEEHEIELYRDDLSKEMIRVITHSKAYASNSPLYRPAIAVINVNESTNLSTESLKAAHKRQLEQRERFIHDIHNAGLRHLAMIQINNQQSTEKLIMRKRLDPILKH